MKKEDVLLRMAYAVTVGMLLATPGMNAAADEAPPAPGLPASPAAPPSPPPAPAPTPAPAAAGDSSSSLTIHGFFNLEYEHQNTATGLGDPNGSFDAKAIELLVNQQFDRFRMAAALDYEHGTDTELGRGHVTLGYGFLEYRFSHALRVRGGKFLAPFGFYNEVHLARNLFLTVKEPLATLKPASLSKNAFRYAPKWEAGLSATGNFSLSKGQLEYVAILGNGDNGETNAFEIDNNPQKSVTGRVQYFPVDQLKIAASYYQDSLSQKPAATAASKALLRGRLRSWGTHAVYTGERLKLLVELAKGRQEAPGSGVTARETGIVGEVGYTLGGKFTPYFQWYHLDTEAGPKSDSATVYVAGVSVQLKNNFFFKIEDDQFNASPTNAKFGAVTNHKYNEIKSLVFYVF